MPGCRLGSLFSTASSKAPRPLSISIAVRDRSLESCVNSSSPGSSSNIFGPSARLIRTKLQRELAETAHNGLRYDFSSAVFAGATINGILFV